MSVEEGKGIERDSRMERWFMVGDVSLRAAASLLCLVSLALIAADSLPGFITFRNLPPFWYIVCSRLAFLLFGMFAIRKPC